MSSSNVRKTADDNQATLQKDPGTAGNANNAALGVTPKDRITGKPDPNFNVFWANEYHYRGQELLRR